MVFFLLLYEQLESQNYEKVRDIITRFNFGNFYGNPFFLAVAVVVKHEKVYRAYENSFYYQFSEGKKRNLHFCLIEFD